MSNQQDQQQPATTQPEPQRPDGYKGKHRR